MNHELNAILQEFDKRGWSVEKSIENVALDSNIQERYPWIPKDIKDFISEIKIVMRSDKRLWVLSSQIYSGASGLAFAWDHWERMELVLRPSYN